MAAGARRNVVNAIDRNPRNPAWMLEILAPQERISLVTIGDDGVEAQRLIVERHTAAPRLLLATLVTSTPPRSERPPRHFDLSPWEIEGESVEFGDDQPARALFLGPTLSHNALYGQGGRLSPELAQVFGSIALSPDPSQRDPALVIRMPDTSYDGLEIVLYDKHLNGGV